MYVYIYIYMRIYVSDSLFIYLYILKSNLLRDAIDTEPFMSNVSREAMATGPVYQNISLNLSYEERRHRHRDRSVGSMKSR